jgi:hypothetical protein
MADRHGPAPHRRSEPVKSSRQRVQHRQATLLRTANSPFCPTARGTRIQPPLHVGAARASPTSNSSTTDPEFSNRIPGQKAEPPPIQNNRNKRGHHDDPLESTVGAQEISEQYSCERATQEGKASRSWAVQLAEGASTTLKWRARRR